MRDYTDPIPPLESLEVDPTADAESETPTHAEPDEVPDGYVRMVHYLTGQRRIVTERAYRAIHQYRGYVLADD